MPVTNQWDNKDKTAILQQYHGSWTWDEYWAGIDELGVLMGEVDRQVDVLVDLSTFEIPTDFMARLKWIDDAVAQLSPTMRYAVLFNTPGLMQAIMRIVRTLYPRVARQAIVVKSREDAQAFLNKHPLPDHTTDHS